MKAKNHQSAALRPLGVRLTEPVSSGGLSIITGITNEITWNKRGPAGLTLCQKGK